MVSYFKNRALWHLGLRVEDLGLRVEGLEFRVWGSGFMVWVSFRVRGAYVGLGLKLHVETRPALLHMLVKRFLFFLFEGRRVK